MPKKISFQDRLIEFVMTAPTQEVRTLLDLGNAVFKNRMAINPSKALGVVTQTMSPDSTARRQRGRPLAQAQTPAPAQAAQPTGYLPEGDTHAATPDASSKIKTD